MNNQKNFVFVQNYKPFAHCHSAYTLLRSEATTDHVTTNLLFNCFGYNIIQEMVHHFMFSDCVSFHFQFCVQHITQNRNTHIIPKPKPNKNTGFDLFSQFSHSNKKGNLNNKFQLKKPTLCFFC